MIVMQIIFKVIIYYSILIGIPVLLRSLVLYCICYTTENATLIKCIKHSWKTLKALKPVYYKWK